MLQTHGHVASLAPSGCYAEEQISAFSVCQDGNVMEQLEIPLVSLFPGNRFELEPKILRGTGIHHFFDFFPGNFLDTPVSEPQFPPFRVYSVSGRLIPKYEPARNRRSRSSIFQGIESGQGAFDRQPAETRGRNLSFIRLSVAPGRFPLLAGPAAPGLPGYPGSGGRACRQGRPRHSAPAPRLSSTTAPAANSPKRSLLPSGQRTATSGTRVSSPSPKCTFGSLLAR